MSYTGWFFLVVMIAINKVRWSGNVRESYLWRNPKRYFILNLNTFIRSLIFGRSLHDYMSLNKKKALVLGATGLIGKELVNIISENEEYEKIHLLVRRPIDLPSEICEVHLVNFDELPRIP